MTSEPTTNHLTDSDCEQILNLFNLPALTDPRKTLTDAVLDGTIPAEQLGDGE